MGKITINSFCHKAFRKKEIQTYLKFLKMKRIYFFFDEAVV